MEEVGQELWKRGTLAMEEGEHELWKRGTGAMEVV